MSKSKLFSIFVIFLLAITPLITGFNFLGKDFNFFEEDTGTTIIESTGVNSVSGQGYVVASPTQGDVVVSLNGNDLNTTINQLIPASSVSYNETYATWLPNYTLYSPFWYNYSDVISSSSYWNLSGSNLFPESLGYSIGIGTASPQTNLDIWTNNSDTSLWSRFPAMQIVNQNRGTNTWEGLQFSDGDQIAAGILTRFTNPGSNYGQLYLSVRGAGGFLTNAQVIDTDGDVGLGIASPDTHLHVYGAGNQRIKVESTNNQAGISLESDSGGEMIIYSPDSSNDLRVYSSTASSDVFTIEDTGEVGIGYTTPSSFSTGFQTVISKNNDQYALALRNSNAGTSTIMLGFFGDTTRKGYIQYLNSSKGSLRFANEYGGLAFLTGDGGTEQERWTLDSTANLTLIHNANHTWVAEDDTTYDWYIGAFGRGLYQHYNFNNVVTNIGTKKIFVGQSGTIGTIVGYTYMGMGAGLTTFSNDVLPNMGDQQAAIGNLIAITKSVGEGGTLYGQYLYVTGTDSIAGSNQANQVGSYIQTQRSGTETMSLNQGLYIRNLNNAGGITTTSEGIRIELTNAGSTTSEYGLRFVISDSGTITNKYSIYQPDDDYRMYHEGAAGFGVSSPVKQLEVGGDFSVTGFVDVGSLGAATATHVCINASNTLSACSSSASVKHNIRSLNETNFSGLSIIRQLKPVEFDYNGTQGEKRAGLLVEDIQQIDSRGLEYYSIPNKKIVTWFEELETSEDPEYDSEGRLISKPHVNITKQIERSEEIIVGYNRTVGGISQEWLGTVAVDSIKELDIENQDLKQQVTDLQQENEAYGLRVTDVEQENTQLKNRLNQVESSLCSLGVQRYCSGFGVGSGETLG